MPVGHADTHEAFSFAGPRVLQRSVDIISFVFGTTFRNNRSQGRQWTFTHLLRLARYERQALVGVTAFREWQRVGGKPWRLGADPSWRRSDLTPRSRPRRPTPLLLSQSISLDATTTSSADQVPQEPSNAMANEPRQQMGRRAHCKSRLGCLSCKRRRVKCNELRPKCSPCHRLGLACVWPPVAALSTQRPVLQTNPSTINLEDLRFYHHFLTVGFPTLPLRGQNVWAQCAAMAHSVSWPSPALHDSSRPTS